MIKLAKNLITKVEEPESGLRAFKGHYLESRDFVRSSIYWMVNSDIVDDLVQETYIKAWRAFERFNEASTFRTWIYRIAMNVTYDYLKKNKGHDEYNDEESVIEDNEMSDLIAKGLLKLPVKLREVFSLHYQQGFTYQEIAELINIAEGTVKSRAHTAKKEFILFLKENGVNNG